MSKNQESPLSDTERELLRKRIISSATSLNSNRRRQFRLRVALATAASIAVLVGVWFSLEGDAEPSLKDFVKEAPKELAPGDEGVTVVLGGGRSVTVGNEEVAVEYSESGADVQVSGQAYRQEVGKTMKPTFNTILVPYGKRTQVRLSDGTQVWINSGSRFIYPALFSEKAREVYLEGEAIFDVAHNASKPFKVISTDQEIEVLGTVFNVSHYPDDRVMTTVLKSGKVRIAYEGMDDRSIEISPGTLSSYDRQTNRIATREVHVEDYFGWREGFLRLRNHPLYFIATKLSRYYNVDIQIEDAQLRQETFSGKLDLKEDVRKVIAIVKETTPFTIIEREGKIILTR